MKVLFSNDKINEIKGNYLSRTTAYLSYYESENPIINRDSIDFIEHKRPGMQLCVNLRPEAVGEEKAELMIKHAIIFLFLMIKISDGWDIIDILDSTPEHIEVVKQTAETIKELLFKT
ncbi:MAG: hypothetical protein OXM61_13540 [Candidatus Poribacteria bacterium]|nr:hypothetical protein [Candidatus Poribacteria bacterium]